ncbi:hypothetical protein KR100_15580 [Synechococcus sp. KORDI-100]|nr:hypothetical protein KR100_15580 [Synechococcus sp. KORDI-100]
MVTAFAANVLLKKPNAQPLVVEKLLFKKAKTSPQLVRKSSTGGALAGKYVIPSVLAPDTSMSRRLARGSTDPLINYGRFIGVVDDTHGMSQQDVAAQLNCNFTNDVEDIKWPFENIAVFSLGEKAQSRARSIDKAKHRVFAEPLKAANILDEVKGLNLFQTVEWDAFVSLSNSDF